MYLEHLVGVSQGNLKVLVMANKLLTLNNNNERKVNYVFNN